MRRLHANGPAPLLLVCSVVLGCDAFTFGVSGADAPVKRIGPSEAFTMDGFGTAVAGVGGDLDGTPVSRIVVGGGADAPFAMYGIWQDDELDLGPALFDACEIDGADMCGPRTGAVSALPQWVDNTGATQQMCALNPEVRPDGGERVRVLCESRSGTADLRGAMRASASGWGASSASLPSGSPAGAALVGAPGNGSNGTVYRYPLEADGGVALDLSSAFAPGSTGARLGESLAVARLDAGGVLLAAGAPGASTVVVAELDSGGAVVRGCLQPPTGADGFGRALAAGDLDGDGEPEIAVGGAGGAGEVWMYRPGELMGPATDCTGGLGPAPAATIACMDLAVEDGSDLACEGSGFGASLATGDVNADGSAELFVGAPTARVRGTTGAGAVWVFPGGSSGPDTAAATALFDGQPQQDAGLGTSVASVPTHVGTADERAEPVAGAPGADEVLVFFCTGLPGDTAEPDSTRCVVQP